MPVPESSEPGRRQVANPVLRWCLLAVGWVAVALGTVGIFLPVLPTTPFLLLAAACFVRSSPGFYHWLVGHPKLGSYVLYYLDGKGMPKKAKIYTLLLMWASLLLTALVLVPSVWVQITLSLTGLGVSWYILRLPTLTLVTAPHQGSNQSRLE
ncbi:MULTISPECIES: YbaN family protein [unclassified Oceanobacter]|uniref:YbaN family protein n=2 Tax=Gammaproteobacteria TaxID=1236 RepID=UPI00273297D6|nr:MULTISPECIES: YbaN family protein [unclassified Oceanobacter]MDP2607549.1 YbaN family protein [Oceanobacter sp. 1_MG-2023]MDP2610817.1 YbaN family protein [Oceanobacter sp. 2_MG-2023]